MIKLLRTSLVLIVCNFCTGILNSQICFENIANELGINTIYDHSTGGGISFCDFNDDGLDDLSVANSGNDNPLFYINDGAGSFENIQLINSSQGIIKQILWVDYDNDGDLDLYFSVFDGHNKLYRNNGNLDIENITTSVGLPTDSIRSFGATWADINRDGFLDLYYTARKIPGSNTDNTNKLFLNNGGKSFTDISINAQVDDSNSLPFCSGIFDYNNDNWPDIYLANDKKRGNKLFKNERDNTFSDVSETTGTGIEMDAMCVAIGDINNDQNQDLYISNISDGNVLLVNADDHVYTEQAESSNTIFNGVAWGCNFVDADNDQLLDLYVSGIKGPTDTFTSAFYQNLDGEQFEQIFCGLENDTLLSFSNALGDFNNDGLTDIVVANNQSGILFYKNQSSSNSNWIKIKLEGKLSNKDAIGAKITVFLDSAILTRMIHCGIGFLAQNSLTENIGIGAETVIDSIHVLWPTGHIDKLYDIESNQLVHLTEGETTEGIIHIDDEISGHYEYFTESHRLIGIDHVSKHSNFMGGGITFIDINNDNYDDLYLTGGQLSDKIYLNNTDGTYADISEESGLFALDTTYYTNGAIAGDVNNDGYQDLFVFTSWDPSGEVIPNLLLINDGNNHFINAWQFNEDRGTTLASVFLDYNQDGLLDIYTVNYVQEQSFIYNQDDEIVGFDPTCYENRMYKNLGEFQFEEVSQSLGLNDAGCGLAVMATDFDFDGDVDILLANDFGEFHIPNKLYKNEIDEGIFVEVSEEWNANQQMYAMGIASADFELDGDLDYYITNFGKNALLVNDDDAFSELAVDLGVDDTWIIEDSIFSVSWGTAFFDFDNDLFSDLYVANGYVPGPGFLPSRVRNQDKFYMNLGDLQFEELTPGLSGLDNELVNRGMAYSDFDLDGDLDLMTAAMRVPQNDLTIRSKFFINNLASENNWLKIKLQGVISNYNGIGALIKVYVGGFCLTKEVHGGSSHCSQNTLIQHFGLKDFEMIDSVVIDWPSQTKGQVLYDITSNQLLTIEEDINLSTNNDSYTDEGLKIYPSPSSGIIYIKDSENILELVNTIQLNDIHGSLIKSDIPINNTLDLSSVQDGIYIITFQFKNGDILNRKLIIQK